MRHVDLDPLAARRAAARCREAAGAHRRTAVAVIRWQPQLAWWGCERDEVARAARHLAIDLRREALALERTADLLDAAVRAAEVEDERRAAAAAAVVATVVPPVVPPRAPAPSPSPPPASSRPLGPVPPRPVASATSVVPARLR